MFPLAMFGLGVPELLIILAVVLLLFGGSRLAGLGKSTGRALKEFKEETKGIGGEKGEQGQVSGAETPTPAQQTHQQPPASQQPQGGYQEPQSGYQQPQGFQQSPAAGPQPQHYVEPQGYQQPQHHQQPVYDQPPAAQPPSHQQPVYDQPPAQNPDGSELRKDV